MSEVLQQDASTGSDLSHGVDEGQGCPQRGTGSERTQRDDVARFGSASSSVPAPAQAPKQATAKTSHGAGARRLAAAPCVHRPQRRLTTGNEAAGWDGGENNVGPGGRQHTQQAAPAPSLAMGSPAPQRHVMHACKKSCTASPAAPVPAHSLSGRVSEEELSGPALAYLSA